MINRGKLKNQIDLIHENQIEPTFPVIQALGKNVQEHCPSKNIRNKSPLPRNAFFEKGIKIALVVFLILFSVSRVDAAGIKGLIGDFIYTIDTRIALQPLVTPGSKFEARYKEFCHTEETLKKQLQAIFRGEDDIADVSMGFLSEAVEGDALLYFRDMIPTDSPSPAARKLLEKMKEIENRRKKGEKNSSEPETSKGIQGPFDAAFPRDFDFPAKATDSVPDVDIPANLAKFQRINDQKPTYYITAREEGFPTSGLLYGHDYNGSERKTIQTSDDVFIEETSGRYFAALCMEGSGVIMDGRTVTFESNQRFKVIPNGCLGITATGYWVVPFHTLAVNREQMPYKGVYFIPGTKGLKLPNGEIHDGYWFAHDTGSAFTNARNRIDMYVNMDEYVNWMEKNFVPSFTPIKVYKVDSETKNLVYAKYQSVLGNSDIKELK
ncbi:MAG: hypothetical protein HQM08_28880 [Candidatus Riflebacteria bacterium]|nr:hypothetical protein [Candidatus Riflebacteria bacterium]